MATWTFTSHRSPTSARSSTERKGERSQAGIEELDLELAIGNRSRLSNQLIKALRGDRAVALVF
jgi:hypothetical protein